MSNECKPCGKFKVKDNRYCGDDLECIGVKKGDSYNTVLSKINEAVCNGTGSGNLVFEDNPDCADSRGFIVMDISGETPEELYRFCVPCCEKDYFYEKNIETIETRDFATPTDWNFPSLGYGSLNFTNSSGITKQYLVNVSYDYTVSKNLSQDVAGSLSGAIISNSSGIDTVEYSNESDTVKSGFIYFGSGGSDFVDIATTAKKVNTTDSLPVEFRFGSFLEKYNKSFFSLINLQAGDSVSLKFKCKNSGDAGTFLNKAQIFVKEL